MGTIKGVDISVWNGKFNAKEAKRQGVGFAILKIVSKRMELDGQFSNNVKQCEEQGIPWGVYNYSYASTVAKAKSDMNKVCDILDGLASKKYFKHGVWFDIEDDVQASLSKTFIADILNAAQRIVEGRGYAFGVYTGLSYYKAHIDRKKVNCKNWWIARYYKGDVKMDIDVNPSVNYKPIDDVVAWQYTSHGRFSPAVCKDNGGNVDLNILYKQMLPPAKKEGKKVAVKIGSARINEKGTVTGGKAGDQTGGEVSTQDWYLHSKGWVVLRPKSSVHAEKIAKCMEMACANDNIGYCQTHRYDLMYAAAQYDYDVSKVKKKVEVDCSALVRVCCLYAGFGVGDFNTSSQLSALRGTGKFDVITDASVCGTSSKLKRGDILVTKTKGHTVVVLTNGSGVSSSSSSSTGGGNYMFETKTIKKGSTGKHVKLAQKILKGLGCYTGSIDGDFGANTEKAVKAYQKDKKLTVDAVIGAKTWASLIGV